MTEEENEKIALSAIAFSMGFKNIEDVKFLLKAIQDSAWQSVIFVELLVFIIFLAVLVPIPNL